ncbi:alpha-glucosidase [Exiguobacterium sp. s28]|uniref:glycoside hydrolase family 13 protein n=1 Tax=Exiguobacterium sp. s28 TaxID=2751238 RepID=UPI00353027DA
MESMVSRQQEKQKTVTRTWWKEAIAYQIYPRSFKDSNGDGIGDLRGIIEKLDYLEDLGIDVIWLCPMYKSPNDDNGYDISDYEDIMEEFGTMEDFDALLKAVHARGMKLLLDLVVNHTSDEHPWFVESKRSKDDPKRDWYIWRDGTDGGPPNNWASIFGGSAWEYDETTEQYYLHVFSKKQPDLNWENEEVRGAVYDMINWWLDKGIDGFRVDAISHIKKMPTETMLPSPDGKSFVTAFSMYSNIDGIHDYLQEMKQATFANYDIMTVGETNGIEPQAADLWMGPDNGAMNMAFHFDHVDIMRKSRLAPLDVVELKRIFDKWQQGLLETGWNALYIENHDMVRAVSLVGDENHYWRESATALGMMYFFMHGTPFIYQGQEIGMKNVPLPSIHDYDDVATKNEYFERIANGMSEIDSMQHVWGTSRDNVRTPIQWDASPNAGFSTTKPWMPIHEEYETLNVDAQSKDAHSILSFYKAMIRLRRAEETFTYGSYRDLLPDHLQVFAYERKFEEQTFYVVVNLTANPAEATLPGLDKATLVLTNEMDPETIETETFMMRPFEARLYRL